MFGANTKSADFESGSTQYLSITDASQSGLDLSANWSISFWVKFEAVTGTPSFFSKYISAGNQVSYQLDLLNSPATLLDILTSANGSTVADDSVSWTPATGTWYHVVYTFNAGSIKFYLDGSQLGATQTTTQTPLYDSSSIFTIGARSTVDSGYLDGLMDDARVWSRTLTLEEVEDLYSGVCDLTGDTNLVASWQFEDDFTDSEGANDLTNNNSVTFSADTPYEECSGGEEGGGGTETVATTTTEILYKDWMLVNGVIIFFLSFIGWGLLFSPIKEKTKQW